MRCYASVALLLIVLANSNNCGSSFIFYFPFYYPPPSPLPEGEGASFVNLIVIRYAMKFPLLLGNERHCCARGEVTAPHAPTTSLPHLPFSYTSTALSQLSLAVLTQ